MPTNICKCKLWPIQYLLKSAEKGLIDFCRVEIRPIYQSAAEKNKQKKTNNFLDKCCLHLQIVADTIPRPQNKRENCLVSKIRINS